MINHHHAFRAVRFAAIKRFLAAIPPQLFLLLAALPAHGSPTYYLFNFETSFPGVQPPTGGFFHDSVTGQFTDFVVTQDGTEFDFTAAANQIGGLQPLPFELGHLGQNLITGYGPLGPELSRWYASSSGFIGFEWRTPANDFLYFNLTIGPSGNSLSSDVRAYSGTWTTTQMVVPEPQTLPMVVMGAMTVWGLRRRRVRAAETGKVR